MTTPRHMSPKGAALAVCLVVFSLAGAGPAQAGITGSPHDWRDGVYDKAGDGFPPFGACSACHVPHFSAGPLTWPRSLSEESLDYNQSSTPDYIPFPTLLCYDCHDTGTTTDADNDPPRGTTGVWLYNALGPFHEPQDIARSGIAEDIALWQTSVGYYELIDGSVPGTPPTAGEPTGGHYWKSEPDGTLLAQGDKISCSLCHDVHDVSTGSTGSKNDAFFRSSTWDGVGQQLLDQYGTNLRKSKNARKPEGTDDRTSGRRMCATCHGYSGTGYQESFFTVTAPKPKTNISAHALSADEDTAVACTSCHKHNKIVASCTECHGFPPMLAVQGGNYFDKTLRPNTENYSGGAGAHRRHVDALGTAIFECEICHGPGPGSAAWHNNGSGTITDGTRVDIIGKSSWWDPDNTRGTGATGYVGNTSSESLPPAETGNYEFLAKGGGNQRCFGLACHGNPPDTLDALNWTDNMLQDGGETPPAFEIAVCTWCHDATPAALDKDGAGTTYGLVKAPNIMGAGSGNAAWGAEVNGHGNSSVNFYEGDAVGESTRTGRRAAGKGCAVCHDATYTAGSHASGSYTVGGPDKSHFDGSYASGEKRLNDSINGKNLLTDIVNVTPSTNDTVRDAACVACHQYTGTDQGLQISTHGNHFNGSAEAAFRRECRSCHEPHGRNWNGATRNLHMVGAWQDSASTGIWGATSAGEEARVDSNASGATPAVAITTGDNAVVFTSRTGTDSFDENDGAYNPAADTDDVCATCHVAAPTAAPYNGTGTGGGSHAGTPGQPPNYLTPGPTGEQRGINCMTCHNHDKDNAVATADAFAPSGCNGCHGDPVPQGKYWPDGTGGNPAYADDNAGAHQNHVQAISRRVFGQTVAQLLADANTLEKQKQICRYCHPDPGGVGHNPIAVGDSRADVLGAGAFGKYTFGAEPVPPASPTADAGSLAYTPGTTDDDGVCNNLVCHNQAATPAWGAVIDWTSPAPPTNCSNTTCHGAATYATPGTTNVHNTHVGTTGRGYACTECHVNNYNGADLRASLQHQNTSVEMNGTGTPPGAWNSAGTIEGTTGGGNGFYDKQTGGAASAGDTLFAYKNGSYAVACYLIYCHGADNTAAVPPNWGGGDTTPVWNNSEALPGGVFCGACHTGNGTGGATHTNGTVVIASGNHTEHLSAAYGPNFGSTGCVGNATIGCHPSHAVTSANHADGTVNFLNQNSTVAVLAATTACDECHGTATGVSDAKGNWSNGSYLLPCLDCHDAANVANSARTGTAGGGVDAPAKSALWTTAGHGRTSGTYTPSGRSGAAAVCGDCHNVTSAHINGALGNTDRLTTNGNTLCNGCHDGAGGGSAVTRVSTHANGTYAAAGAFKDRQRQPFELNCVECHDVHGTSNIYMVNTVNTNGPLVLPRQYNGSNNTTTFLMRGTVAFTDHSVGTSATSGVGFADTNAAGNASKICQTCHTLTVHYEWNSADTHFSGPSVCTSCHPHEFDADNTTQDGFMPTGDCEDCHDGSALSNGAPDVMQYWAGSAAGQDGGHGDTDGLAAVACTGCHDTGQPTSPASAGHAGDATGTYNSILANDSTRSTNTSHLKAEFFTKYPAVGSGDWTVQVAMDNYCVRECHDTDGDGIQDTGEPAQHIRHSSNVNSGANDYNAVEFGVHQTPPAAYPNPDDMPDIPIDVDLNTNAAGGGNYAPCVSCHDPHGTGTQLPGGYTSNKMVRFRFPPDNAVLCSKCHK